MPGVPTSAYLRACERLEIVCQHLTLVRVPSGFLGELVTWCRSRRQLATRSHRIGIREW